MYGLAGSYRDYFLNYLVKAGNRNVHCHAFKGVVME